MSRPTLTAVQALERELAAERARADLAERFVDRLLDKIGQMAPAVASVARQAIRAELAAAPADAAPDPALDLPPAVVALCKRFDDGSARQYSINLRVAREMRAAGKKPEEIARAIMRGERVTA